MDAWEADNHAIPLAWHERVFAFEPLFEIDRHG